MPGSLEPTNRHKEVSLISIFMCSHTRTHSTLNRVGGSRRKRQEESRWHWHGGGGGTKGAFVPALAPTGGLLTGGEPGAGRTGSAYSVRGKFQSAVISLSKEPLPSTLCPMTKAWPPAQAVLEAGAGQGHGEGHKAKARKCPGLRGLRHNGCQVSGGGPLCGPAGSASGRTQPAR